MKNLVIVLLLYCSIAFGQSLSNPDGESVSLHFIPYLVRGSIDNSLGAGLIVNSENIESTFNFKLLIKIPFENVTIAPFLENENYGYKNAFQKQETTFWRYGIGISIYSE